jgi:hypothetical protein
MTMTRDPDLDQAIDDLEFVASRIRHVEQQVVRLDESKEYQTLVRRQHELADMKAEITVRAEKLNMPPRALLLVVEQASRLRRQNRRRPTATQLETVLRTAADLAERDRIEAAANLVLARNQQAHVTTRLGAIDGALKYLEASR